jgi:putative membrane protein insertion efficiency factor
VSSTAHLHGRPLTSVPSRIARAVVLAPVVVYRRVISPAVPRRCKYEPTCSGYAIEAVRRYGVGRGIVLAGWRLLRCNPWSYGGYDPVESQRLFAAPRDEYAERTETESMSQSACGAAMDQREPDDSTTHPVTRP